MQVDSMISRREPVMTMATTRDVLQRPSVGRIVVIAAAVLIQAILILGFVAMSLGLGADGPGSVGADRPSPPARIP